MVIDEKHPYPNENWNLVDWFTAVKVRSDAEVADEATRLGITDADKPWNPNRINATKNGTKTRPSGIIGRDAALDYIKVLSSIADRNDIGLFTAERFEHDVSLFLRSNACREKYAPPSHEEFQNFFEHKSISKQSNSTVYDLRSRVHPSPPIKLFGRDKDLLSVKKALSERPIVLINGVAGDGKTTLAWYSAIHATQSKQFTAFDWTTDKRYVVDAYGHLIPIKDHETELSFFSKLLISLCRQFNWVELFGAQDNQLISGCADRLRNGRYLIVVDNLESVENSATIIRQLLDMLSPLGTDEPLSSRALITSRQQVFDPNVSLVSIEGIDKLERLSYITALQDTWQVENKLSEAQAQEIARLTNGNPLFIQIAVRRYAMMPKTIDQILADIAEGKHQAFNTLFQPLTQILRPDVLCFAVHLAYELSISEGVLDSEDLLVIWNNLNISSNNNTNDFASGLHELVSNRIVSINHFEGYSMHPLIRSYLMTLDDATVKSACR